MTALWIMMGAFLALWGFIVAVGIWSDISKVRSVIYGMLISFICTLAGSIFIYALTQDTTTPEYDALDNDINQDTISTATMVARLDGSGNTARYQSLLQQLSSAFNTNDKNIADLTAGAVHTLKEEGITESFLSILEGVNRISASINGSYNDTMTVYVALRTKSYTHKDAINNIESMWIELMRK